MSRPVSGPAGNAVDVAGPTSRVIERKRTEGVGQALAHPAGGLIDQNGADPDPLIGDHTARSALQMFRFLFENLALMEALPTLVGTSSLGLGTDLEDRQDLESGLGNSQLGQECEEALLARNRATLVVDFCHCDHRVDVCGRQVGDPVEDTYEGSLTPNRIVGCRVVAVHGYAEVQGIGI